jgi:hypothetical protein
MKEVSYQGVFNSLHEVLPDDWCKVVLYCEYGENSYSMKYFVDTGAGEYVDCFNLKDISRKDIIKTFAVIDSQIMPVRKELSEKDKWTVMTLVVDDTGNFKVYYEYTDISDDSIEYFRKWKNKYLKS